MNPKNVFWKIILLWVIFSGTASAQNVTSQMQSLLPPSPGTASLGKYLEIPVSNYTGIPQIQIPISVIKEGDITVPVTLSYHSGGIKVDEVASSSGLGWSLITGGSITRMARGPADDNTPIDEARLEKYLNQQMTLEEEVGYLDEVYKGNLNAEYDVYYLNLGEISCKFLIKNNGKFITLPRNSNIHIQQNVPGYHWIITDGKGIKYKFLDREMTESTTFGRANNGNYNDNGFFYGATAYYLNEIEDTKGNKVNFSYYKSNSSFQTNGMQSIRIPFGGSGYSDSKCQDIYASDRSVNNVDNLDIQRITYSGGSIDFEYFMQSQRLDNPGALILKSIHLKNKQKTLKSFEFFTSYFQAQAIGVSTLAPPNQDTKRLKLDSVLERSGTQTLKPYVFTYSNVPLPYRNSYAQDHWGYANGKNNSEPLSYSRSAYYLGTLNLGADKRPDASYAIGSTLTAIKYPTGGYTEYEFEGNKFLTDDQAYSQQVGRDTVFKMMYEENNDSNFTFDFQNSFTIDNTLLGGKSAFATHVSLTKEGVTEQCGCTITVKMIKPDNSVVYLADNMNLQLEAGNYQIQANITTEFNGNPRMNFTLKLSGRVSEVLAGGKIEADGPGLRVKRIIKHFGNAQTETTQYEYVDDQGLSSGQIGNLPLYKREVSDAYSAVRQVGTTQVQEIWDCKCNLFSSVSNYPLINTQSSFVGYSRVKETPVGNTSNGYKVYTYTNYDQVPGMGIPIYPYLPGNDYDWLRGTLKQEQFFDAGNTLKHSKTVKYGVAADTAAFRSLRLGVYTNYSDPISPAAAQQNYIKATYATHTDAFYPVADTTTVYDSADSIKSINAYSYSDLNYQLKQAMTTNSDGLKSVKKLYYPVDYLNKRSSSAMLDTMLSRRILNIPIEEINTVQRGGNTFLKSSVLQVYDLNPNSTLGFNQPVVSKVYEASTNSNDYTSTYDFVTVPSRYAEKINYTSFNSKAQPQNYIINQVGPPTSYIWGYGDQYPVAEAKGAKVNEIYLANMEEKTDFQDGIMVIDTIRLHSGHFSGRITQGAGGELKAHSKTWLQIGQKWQPRRYHYSAWVYSDGPSVEVFLFMKRPGEQTYFSYVDRVLTEETGKWVYLSKDIEVPGDVVQLNIRVDNNGDHGGGNVWFDDIRLHPSEALMTSYTYDPLIGMTSQMDAKGMTTYFEYDSFQRLKNIKDQNGKVLKHYDYHYAKGN